MSESSWPNFGRIEMIVGVCFPGQPETTRVASGRKVWVERADGTFGRFNLTAQDRAEAKALEGVPTLEVERFQGRMTAAGKVPFVD
jgi:hypothetical protein